LAVQKNRNPIKKAGRVDAKTSPSVIESHEPLASEHPDAHPEQKDSV
jgi:hypothetical protein